MRASSSPLGCSGKNMHIIHGDFCYLHHRRAKPFGMGPLLRHHDYGVLYGRPSMLGGRRYGRGRTKIFFMDLHVGTITTLSQRMKQHSLAIKTCRRALRGLPRRTKYLDVCQFIGPHADMDVSFHVTARSGLGLLSLQLSDGVVVMMQAWLAALIGEVGNETGSGL
jgi:hypothetical protein